MASSTATSRSKRPKSQTSTIHRHIKSIEIDKPHYCLKTLGGCKIELDPGLNFLVGENGIGKSTILNFLTHKDRGIKCNVSAGKEQLKTFFFDSEMMNPRVQREVRGIIDVVSHFQSHGETLMPVLEKIKDIKNHKGPYVILIDEPESGISPWNQVKLRKLYVELSKTYQLIVATHSVVLTNVNVGRVIHLKKKPAYSTPASSFDWKV